MTRNIRHYFFTTHHSSLTVSRCIISTVCVFIYSRTLLYTATSLFGNASIGNILPFPKHCACAHHPLSCSVENQRLHYQFVTNTNNTRNRHNNKNNNYTNYNTNNIVIVIQFLFLRLLPIYTLLTYLSQVFGIKSSHGFFKMAFGNDWTSTAFSLFQPNTFYFLTRPLTSALKCLMGCFVSFFLEWQDLLLKGNWSIRHVHPLIIPVWNAVFLLIDTAAVCLSGK